MSNLADGFTIADCLAYAADLKAVSDSARLDCELLLCHVLEKDRAYLYAWPEKLISDEQQEQFLSLFSRRKAGEPVAHILGKKEFWSFPLLVNNTTLIPRPETELLVELALELLEGGDSKKSVADLGTGTGAIALAIAGERPQWSVLAVEKYPEALALAQQNIERLQRPNVTLVQSDWFQAIPQEAFDLIVANPPYIEVDDRHLEEGDVRFEPLTALVAERQGLGDIETIIQQAPMYLTDGGYLMLEHGYQQAMAVQELLKARGFSQCFTRQDLAGQDRVTGGQYFSLDAGSNSVNQ